MKKLQASYKDDANKTVKQATEKSSIENLNFLIDLAIVFSDIKPNNDEPQTFNNGWNYPNHESSRKWQEAICKEVADINKPHIWQMMQVHQNKWVFKIKHNSVYQVHLMECGYNQVPGIDFSKTTLW